MTTLLQINVAEPDLAKIRDLAREGAAPLVPWSSSKIEMDEQAFKRRGELLTEIEKRLTALIDPA